jgi:NitT/TauT family transport system permease protein
MSVTESQVTGPTEARVAGPRASATTKLVRRRPAMGVVGPPLVLGVAVVLGWQLLVSVGHIPEYLLPSPGSIIGQISDHFGALIRAMGVSGGNALVGLAVGTAFAFLLALAVYRFRTIDSLFGSLAAGAAAVPIVAMAPLFYGMFSATGEFPRRLVVAVVVFFPIYVNMTKGFKQVLPVHGELMRCYAASGWAVSRYVAIPTAMPFLFGALRVAIPGAVITSIVSEYFGGGQNGLAALITTAAGNSAYAQAWAYVSGSVFLGLVAFLVSAALERAAGRSLGWRR